MDIASGFEVEFPEAFIPWGIKEKELMNILGDNLRHVTTGYYTITCQSLGGMAHELGFHFEPRKNGVLNELEFFRRTYHNQMASFEEFQDHFQEFFGPPTTSKEVSNEFPFHQWNLNGATIVHYIFDRFGPEEHMRIKHIPDNKAN